MKPVRDARTAQDYYGTPEEQGVAAPDPTLTGINVQAVRDAIEAFRTGAGTYEQLKQAVAAAKFAVRPTARSEQDLAGWDYVPVQDSFTDTVSTARWQRVLTREQEKELQGMAKFVGPSPSRLQETREG